MSKKFSLNSEVLKRISASKQIEFARSENKGFFAHPAIVLKFDGRSELTIDYRLDDGHTTSSHVEAEVSSQRSFCISDALIPGSNLQVDGIDLSTIKTITSIREFAMVSPEQKQLIIDLLKKITNIKVGKHCTLNKNRKDFVKNAEKIIKNASRINRSKFIPSNKVYAAQEPTKNLPQKAKQKPRQESSTSGGLVETVMKVAQEQYLGKSTSSHSSQVEEEETTENKGYMQSFTEAALSGAEKLITYLL